MTKPKAKHNLVGIGIMLILALLALFVGGIVGAGWAIPDAFARGQANITLQERFDQAIDICMNSTMMLVVPNYLSCDVSRGYIIIPDNCTLRYRNVAIPIPTEEQCVDYVIAGLRGVRDAR